MDYNRVLLDMITGQSFRLEEGPRLRTNIESADRNGLIAMFGTQANLSFPFNRFVVEVKPGPWLYVVPDANEHFSDWLNWFMAAYGARVTRV